MKATSSASQPALKVTTSTRQVPKTVLVSNHWVTHSSFFTPPQGLQPPNGDIDYEREGDVFTSLVGLLKSRSKIFATNIGNQVAKGNSYNIVTVLKVFYQWFFPTHLGICVLDRC